jgi:hypothetical protein
MNTRNTEKYTDGFKAINSFYAMLNKVLEEMMPPPAKFFENGAYGWRGYQITHFHDLAPNQYYCEIYPNVNGLTKQLVFQESYKDPGCQPTDEYAIAEGIKINQYCYPFQVSLDLYRARFFLMELNEQFALLRNFISYAAQQALLWQHSTLRAQSTSPEFLNGTDTIPDRRKGKDIEIHRVEMAFMEAWNTQHNLFQKLKVALSPYQPPQALTESDWWRQNAHVSHFDFRGFFMKSGKLIPDAFDIRWMIYYTEPHLLQCRTSDERLIDQYDLVDNRFFDLPSDEQDKQLQIFSKICLNRF